MNSPKDLHTYYAADKVFKNYGFKNGNPWNTSVQFKTRTVDRDTFGTKTGFTATYHFNVKSSFDFSSLKAVVERPSLWSISLNGTEINPGSREVVARQGIRDFQYRWSGNERRQFLNSQSKSDEDTC